MCELCEHKRVTLRMPFEPSCPVNKLVGEGFTNLSPDHEAARHPCTRKKRLGFGYVGLAHLQNHICDSLGSFPSLDQQALQHVAVVLQ